MSRRSELQNEVAELRSILLGHIEKEQLAAEAERRRRSAALDALLAVKEIKAVQGRTEDNLSKVLVALEAYLDA